MKKNYSKYYSEKSFWNKIKRYSARAGQKVIYPGLLLYYLMKDKKTDLKTKIIITAALGYFIFPADVIPDLTPLIGYADDFGILILTLTRVAKNLTPEIHQKARKKLADWFNQPDLTETAKVDEQIKGYLNQ